MNLSNFISYSYVLNFIFQDCIALADTICSFVSTFFTTYGDESSSSSFAFSVMMKSIFYKILYDGIHDHEFHKPTKLF